MCVSAVTLLAVSAAAQAYASYEQGRQEAASRAYQAQLAEIQAQEARSAARAAAAATRGEGERVRGAARAGYGAAGVGADAGTPLVIDQYIAAGAEQDALTQILQGEARGRGYEAEMQWQRVLARQARRRGNLQAGVSLFRAAADAYTMGAARGRIIGTDSTGAGITRSGAQIF